MWQKVMRRARRLRWGLLDPSFKRVIGYLLRRRLGGARSELDTQALRSQIGNAEPIPPKVPPHQQSDAAIPSIVFQTWKSRADIPINYRYWRNTFIALNPGFECILWDDADNRGYIAEHFPWFLPIYDRYPAEIFRADAIRPFFLLANGGYYADMDTECFKPLETTFSTGDVLLGQMGVDPNFDHSIPNAIMASKPHQLFWTLLIAMMIDAAKDTDPRIMRQLGPETFTGPIILKQAADYYRAHSETDIRQRAAAVIGQLSEGIRDRLLGGELRILNPDTWYPIDWTNPFHRMLRSHLTTRRVVLAPKVARELFPQSTLITYWSHSW